MPNRVYDLGVFINCPFDSQYESIFNAVVFVICDCGFIPRCALDRQDSSAVRMDNILRIMAQCRYGIHDISRTSLDKKNRLPRFNMPLELGCFLGAKRFGDRRQKRKNCLILDSKPHRYQKFISDISGQDIRVHGDEPRRCISVIRDWLATESHKKGLPGGDRIWSRYRLFSAELPTNCKVAHLKLNKLPYCDYVNLVREWINR